MQKYVLAFSLCVLISVTALTVSAAPILVIDGTGNAAPTFTNIVDTNISWGQTVGGLGAAVFDSLAARNAIVTISSSSPRPILGDNYIIQGEIYVTAEDVDGCSQGIDRMQFVFRNPIGGAQSDPKAGSTGGAGGAGMNWFPVANTWTTFSYDLRQETWWTDFSTYEVFRVVLFENDDPNYDNTYAVRNLQLVPEPATLSLLCLGLFGLIRRHR